MTTPFGRPLFRPLTCFFPPPSAPSAFNSHLRFYCGVVHLERLGCLPEDTVRFYVAELASALVYLRDKRIMHRSVSPFPIPSYHPLTRYSSMSNRDLKPDNILLDESGHAHITDFNIAVHYTDKRLLTGVAGSMAYMAPEILAKRGYTYPIDWWSLGVCAYELVFGRRPFRGRTNSALTHSISKDPLRFPEGAEEKCSKAGMQFLKWVSSVVSFFFLLFLFHACVTIAFFAFGGCVWGGYNCCEPRWG